MRQAVVLALIALLAVASADIGGVQITAELGAIGPRYWDCFNQYGGYSYAMIQAWNENAANADFKYNVKVAQSYGFDPVNVYITICEECYFDVDGMVSEVISMLPEGFKGRLFIQPSTTRSQWNSEESTNLNYFLDVAEGFYKQNVSIGVYSNAATWESTFGTNETAIHVVPLLIDNSETPHINTENTLSEHTYFAGWTSNEQASAPAESICGYDIISLVMDPSESSSSKSNPSGNNQDGNKSNPSSGNKSSPSSGNKSSPSSGKSSPSSGKNSGGKDKSGNQEQSQKPSQDTFGSNGGNSGNSDGSDGSNEYSFMDLFSDDARSNY